MKPWQWTLIVVGLVVVLIVVPLAIYGASSEFGGADGAAEEAILESNPDYEPWFSNIWEPPGGETESLLFALQAAIGAGAIFYAFGYIVGRKKGREQGAQGDDGGGGSKVDTATGGTPPEVASADAGGSATPG